MSRRPTPAADEANTRIAELQAALREAHHDIEALEDENARLLAACDGALVLLDEAQQSLTRLVQMTGGES